MTAQMIQRFRALDGFVETWKAALDAAAEQGKDHLVCRSLSAIMHLVVACSSVQASVTQPDMVEDEDLRRQLEQAATQVVVQNPQLAIRAARQVGWTITPHEDHAEEVQQVYWSWDPMSGSGSTLAGGPRVASRW